MTYRSRFVGGVSTARETTTKSGIGLAFALLALASKPGPEQHLATPGSLLRGGRLRQGHPVVMADKKGMKVIEDQDALFESIMAMCNRESSIIYSELNDIITMLRDGQTLVWPSGAKIPAAAVRVAFKMAKGRIEALGATQLVVDEPPPRVPTEMAIKFGGPEFDPEKMSPVESKIKDTSDRKAAVHHPSTFAIEAYDGCATPLTVGGDSFFVHIRGPARVRGRVTDNGDGTYKCTWTPPLSGFYQIAVSSFGISLPGSPFTFEATTPLPFAPNCVASGTGLTAAVARATQTFEVEFKDKLGYVTQAVDLDVYLESMPVGSPRSIKVSTTRAPPSETVVEPKVEKSPAARRSGEDGEETDGGEEIPERKKPEVEDAGGMESADEDNEGEFVRQRTVRYKVKQPLVIRETEDLESPQIGQVQPGQMMTIVLEKGLRDRVRAMIALDSISRKAEVIDANNGMFSSTVDGGPDVLSPPPAGDGQADPTGNDGAAVDPADEAAQMHQDIAGVVNDGGIEALKGKVGWVTTIKNGKRFVTSKVRQSTSSRQQHVEQWARRMATDRAFSKGKAAAGDGSSKTSAAALSTPNVSLEINADPSGIGFAFGGVYPGVLYAKGKMHDKHKVSFSVGKVGKYLLHVRLRQMAVALPGSPFRLEVSPNDANALSTKLPAQAIAGKVGTDGTSGCGVTIKTFDLMGNACVAGGALVTGNPVDKSVAEQHMVTVTVTDNEDGTYRLHWRSNMSGTYAVAIRIANDHVAGSPCNIRFHSVAPLKEKTVVSGDGLASGTAGLPSRFRLSFFDMYDNQAVPGPDDKLGLALLQGKTYKDVSESHEYTMAPVDAEGCEQEVTFTPSVEGTFSLHIWAESQGVAGTKERSPLTGSPFQCVVIAGPASPEVSFVDGWNKESRAVDKHGKAVEQRPDLIIAGDAVICRPVICDALGNKTVPDEGTLDISLKLPNGTTIGVEHPSLKLIEGTKGGVTTYDVRHDATHAGEHELHILLNARPIKGSPVLFNVAAAVPEVKTAKLTSPTENPLYSNTPYTIELKTFDRFNNPIPHGGLAVATRLQIVKNNAHDLTTLVPNNHTIDVVDNEDGTYCVSVMLIKIAATVKAIVNMDKNLPAAGGELPAIQLTFELPEAEPEVQEVKEQ